MQINERAASVDVFVTTYGEDLDVIRRTVAAALAIRGRHRTLVLDDGRSDEVRELAARARGRVRPPSRQPVGAKAGNINHALSITDGEFFAVFDADFAPRPEFLHETLPVLRHRQGRLRPDARRPTATCTRCSPAGPATCSRCSTR